MLGRWVSKRIEREGHSKVFEGVSESLKNADLRLCNLENALSDEPFTKKKRFLLQAPTGHGKALQGYFDIVSVANNHTLDCGPTGLENTLDCLAENKIHAVGSKGSSLRITKKGIRLGFFAFTEFEEADLCSFADFKQWIASARQEVDLIIVSVHWGVELSTKPSEKQRKLSDEMAELGVDLIVGHHPHVLQPIEMRKVGNGRNMLVAYSLGDFVFDSPPGVRRETGVLKVIADKDGVKSYKFEPAKITGYFPVSKKPRS